MRNILPKADYCPSLRPSPALTTTLMLYSTERDVVLERPIFETARERRAEGEKTSQKMSQEEENVDQHQVFEEW